METPPKRQRLSKKQVWFLNNVFESGQTVTDVLRDLHIRPGSLDRWLTKPIFRNRLRMYLNQYYLQARMELARSTPMAVSSLSFLTEKSLKHTELRRACNDLLNFHTQFAKASSAAGTKQAQNGVVSDKLGVLLEQFGVVLDHNGVIRDNVGDTKTPQKHLLDAKKAENTKNLGTRASRPQP